MKYKMFGHKAKTPAPCVANLAACPAKMPIHGESGGRQGLDARTCGEGDAKVWRGVRLAR